MHKANQSVCDVCWQLRSNLNGLAEQNRSCHVVFVGMWFVHKLCNVLFKAGSIGFEVGFLDSSLNCSCIVERIRLIEDRIRQNVSRLEPSNQEMLTDCWEGTQACVMLLALLVKRCSCNTCTNIDVHSSHTLVSWMLSVVAHCWNYRPLHH